MKMLLKDKQENLKRGDGVWDFSAYIVNFIIGAGVFVLSAIVTAGLGLATIIEYLFGVLLITLVILCFSGVGSKIIDTNGAYSPIGKTYGKHLGFITAMLFISVNSSKCSSFKYCCGYYNSNVSSFQEEIIRILFFM